MLTACFVLSFYIFVLVFLNLTFHLLSGLVVKAIKCEREREIVKIKSGALIEMQSYNLFVQHVGDFFFLNLKSNCVMVLMETCTCTVHVCGADGFNLRLSRKEGHLKRSLCFQPLLLL